MFKDSLAKFFKVDSLISNLTGYVETRIELLKMEAKEELSKSISAILIFLLIAFIVSVVIIFFSIGIAFVLSERVGGFYGFSIVALFYLVIAVVLLLNQKSLRKKLEKKIGVGLKNKN